MKRVNVVVIGSASALIVASACSVFEPPLLEGDGSGGRGETGGSGSGNTNSGGTATGGIEAGLTGGEVGSGGDASGGSGSGGATNGGTGGKGTGGQVSTGPFWIESRQVPLKSGGTVTCEVHRRPSDSDRPAASDPGEDLPPIIMAIHRARHGSANDDESLTKNVDAWEDIGFDMDGACTKSSTCEDPEEFTLISEQKCKNSVSTPSDGNHCIDNAIGKLFNIAASTETVGKWFGLTEQDWNCELYRGGFSTIIKVSGYNGKKNDDLVRVDQYISTGLKSLPTWQCRAGNRIEGAFKTDWYNAAPWFKTDHWKISDRSIDTGSNPPGNELPASVVADGKAFVRNGYLFAKFPERSEFWWNGENASIPGMRNVMYSPITIAKIEQDRDDNWTLKEGVLNAVVRPNEQLVGFKEIGYCENMCKSFDAVRDYLNGQQDVFLDLTSNLPDAPCEAMSFGMAFEARQATADRTDIVPVAEPEQCPQPRHPDAPRQGCVCNPISGVCETPDGG